MKRNYDLIRKILIIVENHPMDGFAISLNTRHVADKFPMVTDDELNEHIQMLVDHQFLEGEPHQLGWFITRLTWLGHDFIEMSKEKTVWEKAKHYAGHLSLDLFNAVLKQAAVSFSTQMAFG